MITLFDGADLVRSLSHVGSPDPSVLSVFAGIESTLTLDNVQLFFGFGGIAFTLDSFSVTAVPEPATDLVFFTGFAELLLRARQRLNW